MENLPQPTKQQAEDMLSLIRQVPPRWVNQEAEREHESLRKELAEIYRTSHQKAQPIIRRMAELSLAHQIHPFMIAKPTCET